MNLVEYGNCLFVNVQKIESLSINRKGFLEFTLTNNSGIFVVSDEYAKEFIQAVQRANESKHDVCEAYLKIYNGNY